MKSRTYHFRNWIIKATSGLSLIGLGACLVAESALMKYDGAGTAQWVLSGFVALVVLNSGVCLVGDAVKHRVHLEREEKRQE